MTKEQGRQATAKYLGIISVHDIYTLDEARRRLRWTESTMRTAQRRGLKQMSCGKRKYITGWEIIHFLEDEQKVKYPAFPPLLAD